MDGPKNATVDRRHHVRSLLMRESLLDKQVMSSTETPVCSLTVERMSPDWTVYVLGWRFLRDGVVSPLSPVVDVCEVCVVDVPSAADSSPSPRLLMIGPRFSEVPTRSTHKDRVRRRSSRLRRHP